MQAAPEFMLDLSQLGPHSFRDSLPKHDKSSGSGSIAYVREPEKVERFGLPFATSLAVVRGVTPELDQAGFVGMQLQGELAESIPQVRQQSFGIRSVFEAHHEVIGITHDEEIAPRMSISPLIERQTETRPPSHSSGHRGCHRAIRKRES